MDEHEKTPPNGELPETKEHDNQFPALAEEAAEVLGDIPEDKRNKLVSFVRAIGIERHHQGPIPCPEDIAEYNKHIPNGADRIMKMAEEQSKHRIEIENQVITSQQRQSERGQILGFIIGIVGIASGLILALSGHDWIGGIIAGTTVISLVSTFVLGKRAQRRNLNLKQKPLPPNDSSQDS